MSDSTPTRSSHEAVLPDDVTDLLLWRLAYDVAAAHQPDETGRCTSLLCVHQSAPCAPMVNAQRAMVLARGGAPAAAQPTARDTAAPKPRNRRRRAA